MSLVLLLMERTKSFEYALLILTVPNIQNSTYGDFCPYPIMNHLELVVHLSPVKSVIFEPN